MGDADDAAGHPPAGRPVGPRRPATDAEARALASAVRLRILRMCLDEPHTNAQLAARLGRPPASVLHHVRTLVATGFLEAQPAARGPRGSRPVPYRATGRSWSVDASGTAAAVVEAFVQTLPREAGRPAGASREGDLRMTRLGLRLDQRSEEELLDRVTAVLEEFAARTPDPTGRPWSVFFAAHPDPDRA